MVEQWNSIGGTVMVEECGDRVEQWWLNIDGGTLMVEQWLWMGDWPLEKANFAVGLNPRFY